MKNRDFLSPFTRKKTNDAKSLCESPALSNKGNPSPFKIQDQEKPLDLVVIDDVFPCPYSAFRLEEFMQLLRTFDNMRIYCNGTSLHLITKETNHDIICAFQEKYPSLSNKVVEWQGFDVAPSVQAKLAYFCFLHNVYYSLESIEQQKIPFVFELYPGGGFALGNDESDRMLRRVTCSPYFRKVIVSQKITRDYLIENKFCKASKIETVFGVVTPSERFRDFNDNSVRYGIDKDRLDICFVAMRYTPLGEDKGYDIFIQVAKELCKKHDNIYFHVVGSFDETVIDVSDIREHISFYGVRPMDWFDSFYQDKDIILSPNTHGKIQHGAFDGFPTGCCIDAGLREVAIFCTDDLHQNDGYFVDKAEMMIVEHNVADIVHKIEYYYESPDELRRMSTRGRAKIKQLYSLEAQLEPRIQILKQEIESSVAKKKDKRPDRHS